MTEQHHIFHIKKSTVLLDFFLPFTTNDKELTSSTGFSLLRFIILLLHIGQFTSLGTVMDT